MLELRSVRRRAWARAGAGVLALAGMLAVGGCASTSEILLSAQFENQAPSGILAIDHPIGQFRAGDFGTVRVVAGPAMTSGNWLQLIQAQRLVPPAHVRGVFAAYRGDGHYLFTMRLVIPTGSAASVSFQSSNAVNPTNFVTVAFPSNGYLFSQDGGAIVGRFPHDQPFSVAVNLTIGATSSATVTLLGMAHGSAAYTVEPRLNADARNFLAIELDTDVGTAASTFFVNDISMIYNAP
jgi:hypothetical protein